MENNTFLGYKFKKTVGINRKKSKNPLAKLSYKELQAVAREMHLPCTKFEHKVLLALVIAKKQGRNDIVQVILDSDGQMNPIYKPENSFCKPQFASNVSHFDKAQFTGNISGSSNMVISNPYDLEENICMPGPFNKQCDLTIPGVIFDGNLKSSNAIASNEISLGTKSDMPESQISLDGDNGSEIAHDKVQENVNPKNMSLALLTPNVSFDSGNGSFCSFSLDDQSILDNQLLKDRSTEDLILCHLNGSEDTEEMLDFSLVKVLEGLCEY